MRVALGSAGARGDSDALIATVSVGETVVATHAYRAHHRPILEAVAAAPPLGAAPPLPGIAVGALPGTDPLERIAIARRLAGVRSAFVLLDEDGQTEVQLRGEAHQ